MSDPTPTPTPTPADQPRSPARAALTNLLMQIGALNLRPLIAGEYDKLPTVIAQVVSVATDQELTERRFANAIGRLLQPLANLITDTERDDQAVRAALWRTRHGRATVDDPTLEWAERRTVLLTHRLRVLRQLNDALFFARQVYVKERSQYTEEERRRRCIGSAGREVAEARYETRLAVAALAAFPAQVEAPTPAPADSDVDAILPLAAEIAIQDLCEEINGIYAMIDVRRQALAAIVGPLATSEEACLELIGRLWGPGASFIRFGVRDQLITYRDEAAAAKKAARHTPQPPTDPAQEA